MVMATFLTLGAGRRPGQSRRAMPTNPPEGGWRCFGAPDYFFNLPEQAASVPYVPYVDGLATPVRERYQPAR